MTTKQTATAVVAAAVFAVIGVLLWRTPPVATPVADAHDSPELAAAVRLIEAQSRGVATVPQQQAVRVSASGAASPAPEPPDGYSFTSAPEEMAQVLAAVQDDGGTPSDVPAWMAVGATAEILRTARQMRRDWVYGWLLVADGADVGDVGRAIASAGFEVLGSSGRLLRAKLPADEASLNGASGTDGVAGLGVLPPLLKSHSAVRDAVLSASLSKTPVLVTLMDGDDNGRWRRELSALGVEVGSFDADIRAYAANVDAVAFDAVVQADFVLAVEPMGLFRAAHDTSVPAMGADALRRHLDMPGLFSGTAGGAVPIGVMDTGLNTSHLDISSHRTSICGANFVSSSHRRDEDADLWEDSNGHGTHVTGTIVGNGFVEARYAGMAPSVEHIRFAKVLSRGGSGLLSDAMLGMDYLAAESGCGSSPVAAKPLVVNMSLSADSRAYEGRTPHERKLDAVVWSHRQLYVVAQSNADISGFSIYGAAKNSLPVGAIQDNGELAEFSSVGPTFDGRLAPLVVATGVSLNSARGGGSRGAYRVASGTSMASPTVAGVATLLMDAVEGYRERPALVRARLMASAIKPDRWLDAPAAFPATNTNGPGALQARYGLGKASARTAVLQRRSERGWESGAATRTVAQGTVAYRDIEVPDGSSRLDVVLTWDEPPADTIGGTVLNDIDLWLDKDGDCPDDVDACGEHSSTSRKDNVEWIIVRNPAPGTYRIRVVGHRVYTAKPRAAVAWTVVRGPSTPNLRLAPGELDSRNGQHRVELELSTDGYVAAAVRVGYRGCRRASGEVCRISPKKRPVIGEDGIEHSSRGTSMLVGEVGIRERQKVVFDVPSLPWDEATRLYFAADSWNANPVVVSVVVPAQGGAESPTPVAANAPGNDDFRNAMPLTGAAGEVDVDLVAATFEVGEPPAFHLHWGGLRPAMSAWFRWVAPATGAVRFSVTPSAHLDVLRGDQIAALTPVVSKGDGVSFLASEGEAYLVRVSHHWVDGANRDLRVTLDWTQGARPRNDDFAHAQEVRGIEGVVTGDNRGATLEPGERVGDLAATVWYRWEAPEDGHQLFSGNHSRTRVLVFVGDAVDSMRLVSGKPSMSARAPVKSGAVYRVAVAALNADREAGSFELQWRKEQYHAGADDVLNAVELTGESGDASAQNGESVEPGEPVETGVRTRWWQWVPPADGRYTWRMSDGGSQGEMRLSAFVDGKGAEDPSLVDFRPVGSTAPGQAAEFVVNAAAERRYWLSVGFHNGSRRAFLSSASTTLAWGRTPTNDAASRAIALTGGSGEVTGTNAFATLSPNEASGALGHSSVWWTYSATTTGWHRFWVEGDDSTTLAVYRQRPEGPERVARSHGEWRAEWETGTFALFNADEGQQYLIRVGRRGTGSGGEWTLRWDRADAPVWLRYAGSFGVAGHQEVGDVALAFEDRGEALYLGVANGMQVLARDAESGALSLADSVEVATPEALVWDQARSRLYAFVGCEWARFAPDGSRLALAEDGRLEVEDDGDLPCGDVEDAFMGADGAHLHVVKFDMDVYAIDDAGAILTETADIGVGGVQQAVPGPGATLFVTDGGGLYAFEPDPATGDFAMTGEVVLMVPDVRAMALDDDGRVLILGRTGNTAAFDASDAAQLRHIAELSGFVSPPSWRDVGGKCRYVSARSGSAGFDAFCLNSAFTVDVDEERLRPTDHVAYWQDDHFNNSIPLFEPTGMAASPDGRHVYVHSDGKLLIFERVDGSIDADVGITANR